MTVRNAVYSIMGAAILVLLAIPLWPLLIAAGVAIPLLSRYQDRWWYSLLCFILAILFATGIALVVDFPTNQGPPTEGCGRYC